MIVDMSPSIKEGLQVISHMFNCIYHPVSFSLQAEYNEMITTQLDASNDGGREEHLTAGGVKLGGKNREERAGELQMRRLRDQVYFLPVPFFFNFSESKTSLRAPRIVYIVR